MDTKHIKISDYNYDLPDDRIAKFPIAQRDHSKLLVYKHGEVSDDVFHHLPTYLPQGALMIFNNTKVIQARLHFRKETGALIEVFLMEPAEPTDYELMFQTTGHCSWLCMIGNLKKWKEGSLKRDFEIKGHKLTLSATMRRGDALGSEAQEMVAKGGGTNYWVDFDWDNDKVSFAEILEAVGELPIPPYLNRKTEESDKTTYQTVYSKIKGSVAAPTAGLHFTDAVLKDLDAHGIDREEVTLHVGAGTFKPVKSLEIEGHQMHTEYIVVHRRSLEKLIKHECRDIAVGTTSVRTIESLYYMGVHLLKHPEANEEDLHVKQWDPYELSEDGNLVDGITPMQAIIDYLDRNGLEALHSSTQIIIAPGYQYKIVKMLVTNFHQPQSTLLLLVSAFLKGDWKKVYDYALSHDFRFLSYGDSSLLIP